MAATLASELVCNPMIGDPPELEWVPIADLNVDESYQRSIEAKTSVRLIRSIARDWDWRLCQPLDVARREDETLWVTDGQHRLAGAKLRGDIVRLPCIITASNDRGDEASLFVALNRKRRGLSAVDVFKANLVKGDADARVVDELIRDAGLSIATHQNYIAWKPGMIYCVPGVMAAYKRHGRHITSNALVALSEAFSGKVLRYAGQILRALVIVYATEGRNASFDADRFIDRLSLNEQTQWMRKAAQRVAVTGMTVYRALAEVLIEAYRAHE